jgi:hypothetical protein
MTSDKQHYQITIDSNLLEINSIIISLLFLFQDEDDRHLQSVGVFTFCMAQPTTGKPSSAIVCLLPVGILFIYLRPLHTTP